MMAREKQEYETIEEVQPVLKRKKTVSVESYRAVRGKRRIPVQVAPHQRTVETKDESPQERPQGLLSRAFRRQKKVQSPEAAELKAIEEALTER